MQTLTVAAMNRKAGAALAAAVERANRKTPRQLADELAQALATIERLQARISTLQDGAALASGEFPKSAGETIDGRPVVTIAQAARACRISYQAAYRRVVSGKWKAAQLGSRDWRVFVDADGAPLLSGE